VDGAIVNVTAIRESDWNKDDGTTVKVTDVTFDSGFKAPGYDLPSVPEIGKPLPDGWEVATSKAGKPYIKVPKRGGGGGGGAPAYRNTKEGQAFEQQQMNRRTAIMQARHSPFGGSDAVDLQDAERIYRWLQSSEGVGVENDRVFGEGARSAPTTTPSVDPPVPSSSVEASHGEGGASSKCLHPAEERIPSPVDRMAAKGWTICKAVLPNGKVCDTAIAPVAVNA
jgi:hypothetical protein